MPEIKNQDEFEPNVAARREWLGTRKKTVIYELPGLFITDGFEKDRNWFIFAFIIECIAIVLTLYGGFSRGGLFILWSILGVFCFISFDYVGALWFHKPIAKRCEIKNRIVVSTTDIEKTNYGRDLKRISVIQIFGAILIVFSSFLKIIAILLLGRFILIFYIIMSVFYLIVIYIHLAHTGYFLIERKVGKMFTKQHNKWLDDMRLVKEHNLNENQVTGKSQTRESEFHSSIKIFDESKNTKLTIKSIHSIIYSGTDQRGKFIYKIETKGILLDNEIISFLGKMSTEEEGDKVFIAKQLLKHQVEQML